MQDVIQNLVNLQYIDIKLDELQKQRGDLPEDILDHETDIVRFETRINRNTTQLKDLELEKAKLELEIDDAHDLMKKYESQQMSVRNNREYDALTKEIESQKQLVENAHSRLEEIAILKEELEKELIETRALLDEKKDELSKMKGELQNVIQKTEKEEEDLLKLREEAAALVNQRYLRSYERLRKGLANKLAVCPMKDGACMGIMMPPQVQMEVRRMNKIIIDENSGRIVVDPSFFEEAQKQVGL
jgi:predicted  nucleic acid-binding Zn-ribbon protein